MGTAGSLNYKLLSLEDNLKLNLAHGVDETLQEMANVECVFEKSFTDTNWEPPAGYSVALEIQAPQALGQIRFHFSHIVLARLYNNIMNE